MGGSNLFGQRNMSKLKIKIKLVVFYGVKEDKDILNELTDKCNTSTCQYSIIPINIGLVGSTINEIIIKKRVKTCVPGYKKDLDKVCIIEPNIIQSDRYILFDSVDSFKTWFLKIGK